jgi:hypothetical protein
MPTAIITDRIAKPIFENLSSVSNSEKDHSFTACNQRPNLASIVSIGVVNTKRNIAVMGNKKTTVSNIAKPLLAITGFNDLILMPKFY